jgi:hypothetical protein
MPLVVVPFSVDVAANPIPEEKCIRAKLFGPMVMVPPTGRYTQNTTAVVPNVGVPAVLKNSTQAGVEVGLLSEKPYRFPAEFLMFTAAPVALMKVADSAAEVAVEGAGAPVFPPVTFTFSEPPVLVRLVPDDWMFTEPLTGTVFVAETGRVPT